MKHITVKSREEAIRELDKIFPCDYMKEEEASKNAGYDIYTGTSEAYASNHWCDLGCRFEINLNDYKECITIWIKEEEKPAKKEISAELYRDLWMMIEDKVSKAKANEEMWINQLCEFPEATAEDSEACIKYIRKAHKEIEEYTALLERFEAELKEGKR